jgi:hypothetical protein
MIPAFFRSWLQQFSALVRPPVVQYRGRFVPALRPGDIIIPPCDDTGLPLVSGVGGGSTFVGDGLVYRPGGLSRDNVFGNWPDLYAKLVTMQGPVPVQIDDSIISPAVIPAGVWDAVVTLIGMLTRPGGINVLCQVADGATFPSLREVRDNLTISSRAATVPMLTLTDGQVLFLQRGAIVQRDPAAVRCPILAPAALVVQPTIVLDLGGVLGVTTAHVLESQALGPAAPMIALLDFAGLPADVLEGAGDAGVVLVTDTAFFNSALPPVQPALTGTLWYLSAQWVHTKTFIVPLAPANWLLIAPTNLQDAIERIAAQLAALGGPIP